MSPIILPQIVHIESQSLEELRTLKYPRPESVDINGITYTKFFVRNQSNSLGSWIVTDSPLSEDEKQIILDWVRTNFIIRKSPNYYSSYFLKHILEKNTGIYTYAGQFEYAMLSAGFTHVRNWHDINLHFSISQKSPALKMPSMG